MPYGIATVRLSIPASTPRLESFGYSNTVLMRDIWPFSQTANSDQISAFQSSDGSQKTTLPVLFIQRVGDITQNTTT